MSTDKIRTISAITSAQAARAAQVDFAAKVAAVRTDDEFVVFMKNYIATHFTHMLGSKVLLLNTRDGLDTLSAMVKEKLAERRKAEAPFALPAKSGRATVIPMPQRRAA